MLRPMSRLRRSNCAAPGIARRRRGRGFEFRDPCGERVEDAEVLERVSELAIPPVWREVWICMDPLGHLQATGLDAAGRKQYLYHERWRARRDRRKFDSIGSEDYAERNESYGLTTMLREHVTVGERELLFDFPAKSGQRRVQEITDSDALAIVAARRPARDRPLPRRRDDRPTLERFDGPDLADRRVRARIETAVLELLGDR
jgi:DNA topoisomerase I